MKNLLIAAGMLLCIVPVNAKAIDLFPGDYTVLPDGTNVITGYFQFSDAKTLRLDEPDVSLPDSSFRTTIGIAQYMHYTEIGGLPAAFQINLPFGNLDARIGGADAPSSDGLGDLVVAATVWPLSSDQPYGTTLGLTTYLTAPTGNFDAAGVSLGSGTWTVTPQIGLIQGLGEGLTFEGAVDVALQADHTEGGIDLSRNPSVQVQTYLRYKFSERASVAVGYSGLFGGKQFQNGVYTQVKTRSNQIRLAADFMISEAVFVQGLIGRDLHVDGGFKNGLLTQIGLSVAF